MILDVVVWIAQFYQGCLGLAKLTSTPSVPNYKRFGFSRYIVFSMYLDIVYIYVHSKSYISRKAKTSYNLGRIE
jgi:hypothetical protein